MSESKAAKSFNVSVHCPECNCELDLEMRNAIVKATVVEEPNPMTTDAPSNCLNCVSVEVPK